MACVRVFAVWPRPVYNTWLGLHSSAAAAAETGTSASASQLTLFYAAANLCEGHRGKVTSSTLSVDWEWFQGGWLTGWIVLDVGYSSMAGAGGMDRSGDEDLDECLPTSCAGGEETNCGDCEDASSDFRWMQMLRFSSFGHFSVQRMDLS